MSYIIEPDAGNDKILYSRKTNFIWVGFGWIWNELLFLILNISPITKLKICVNCKEKQTKTNSTKCNIKGVE